MSWDEGHMKVCMLMMLALKLMGYRQAAVTGLEIRFYKVSAERAIRMHTLRPKVKSS